MFSGTKKQPPLSELEHLIMGVLWKRPRATAEDVRNALAARHPMKESTTRTILKRLEDKGYVRRDLDGRVFVYSGVEEAEHVAVKAVRQILERFCGGSVERLLVGMVDGDVIGEEELELLARRIASRKPEEA
ncbi:MAG TPA: BlaI/MecI/CopY family transcriptional regulator [Candidatus Solibacter sp.]|nr:BlaI/MecI/CopY family transcriptional regulator [Candidatus Solibacter sp.]